MLKNLLFTFFAVMLMAVTASAQFVYINSPANLEGSYQYGPAAGWGADLTTDVWTGDVVIADDGVDVGSDGCESPFVNGAAMSGNFALIDRGACEFGLKALNAEMEGATAVVIFNNAPGAGVIDMGGGASGGMVTIPVVMLSFEDGQLIRDALAAGETVNMTIGNIQFPNNIGISGGSIANPLYGTTPVDQADALGYGYTTGAAVTNLGANLATNVTVAVDIQHQPVPGGSGLSVYSNTASLNEITSDSTEFISTGDYVVGEGIGVYTASYSISADSTDESTFDNAVSSSFSLTENVYCKCSWDYANDRPFTTTGLTIGGGGAIEILSGFQVPNGQGLTISELRFQLSLNAPLTVGELEEGSVQANIYEWVDANEDGNATNDELEAVSINIVEFPDPTAEDVWLTVPVFSFPDFEPGVEIDGPDKFYFVGTRYEGSQLVFFSFDESFDNLLAIDQQTQMTTADFPYLQTSTFDVLPDIEMAGLFTDFGGSAATGMVLTGDISSNTDEDAIAIDFNVFPNPTSDLLNVEIGLEEVHDVLEYRIVDNQGRMVFNVEREVKGLSDKTSFNVGQLAGGQYFLVVQSEKGISSKSFNVQR